MLNIENNNKAFHISFYPHTSLTAGLNIFEKTFHSRRKRMHIHIYTCKWTCLPAINQKSKLQYHQSPSIRRRKTKQKNIYIFIYAPTQKSISQLVHSPFSEQAAFKVGHWSQFLRMEYQTLHYQTPPLWIQTRGPLEILHLLQMSDFWC